MDFPGSRNLLKSNFLYIPMIPMQKKNVGQVLSNAIKACLVLFGI